MSRLGLSFAALSLALTALGGAAWAQPNDDRDVARLVSFGGMCVNCELSGRKLTGAKFTGANFDRAVLIGADLRGAAFYGSNFSGADLTRARLRGVRLRGADLRGARLDGCDVDNVDWREVRIDLAQAVLLAQVRGAVVDG